MYIFFCSWCKTNIVCKQSWRVEGIGWTWKNKRLQHNWNALLKWRQQNQTHKIYCGNEQERKKTVNIDKIDIDKAIVVHEMINTNIQNNIQKITDIFHVFHSTSTIIIIYKQLEKWSHNFMRTFTLRACLNDIKRKSGTTIQWEKK